jgi:hypothetical protein
MSGPDNGVENTGDNHLRRAAEQTGHAGDADSDPPPGDPGGYAPARKWTCVRAAAERLIVESTDRRALTVGRPAD